MYYVVGAAVIGAGAAIYSSEQNRKAAHDAGGAGVEGAITAAQVAADAQQRALETSLAAQKEATIENVAAATKANQEAIDAIIAANITIEQATKDGAAFSDAEFQKVFDYVQTTLNPWVETGVQANAKLQNLTGLNGTDASLNALRQDPIYQSRVEAGQQVVERSAANKGNLFSGNTGIALKEMEGDEFSRTFNRLLALSESGRGAATQVAGARDALGTRRSANNWKVQDTISDNALNLARTRQAGSNNIANAQAGGAQRTADLTIAGANRGADVASEGQRYISDAQTSAAYLDANARIQNNNNNNALIGDTTSLATTAYLRNNPNYQYNSLYSNPARNYPTQQPAQQSYDPYFSQEPYA